MYKLLLTGLVLTGLIQNASAERVPYKKCPEADSYSSNFTGATIGQVLNRSVGPEFVCNYRNATIGFPLKESNCSFDKDSTAPIKTCPEKDPTKCIMYCEKK